MGRLSRKNCPPCVILSAEEFHRRAVKWNEVELLRVEDAIFATCCKKAHRSKQKRKYSPKANMQRDLRWFSQCLLNRSCIFSKRVGQRKQEIGTRKISSMVQQTLRKPIADPFLGRAPKRTPSSVLRRFTLFRSAKLRLRVQGCC